MKRRRLVSVLGIAAIAMAATCCSLLDRRSQAEQLLEILAGKRVPDAAWAFVRLAEIGDEDLRVLARHVDDSRSTPLEMIFVHGWQTNGPGPKSTLTIDAVARHFLLSRTFAGDYRLHDDGPRIDPGKWDRQGWAKEVERFLRAHERPYGRPVEPRITERWWFGGPSVSPPSCPASLFFQASPESAERIVDALCGDDAARSIWFFETLRRAPDETLDGFVDQILSAKGTKVCIFCGKTDSAKRDKGFALGRLIQLLLSERVGDEPLHYSALRAAELTLPGEPELVAMIETAWRTFRAKGNASKESSLK